MSATTTAAEKASEKNIRDKSVIVTCLMLASIESKIQKRFDLMDAYTIMPTLRTMFKGSSKGGEV